MVRFFKKPQMYNVEAESIIKDTEISSKSFDDFLSNLEMKIIARTDLLLEIDLMNCHPSIANAIRRILISEIPTIAIHNVLITENDTIFPDEYVAHRLGLIPIDVDPELLQFKQNDNTWENTIRFRLAKKNDLNDIINVYSEDIVWIPLENQETYNVSINPGILICKLAPGNSIDMEMLAEKGIGMTHAKWSPVSLCSYKLMSKIVLQKEFLGDEALELQKCFSDGVIEIVGNKAVVKDPRKDTMSREVLRHDKFRDTVKLLRESGWFCFTIESLALDPMVLLKKAIQVLISKCNEIKENIDILRK